jgi:hypothetical protein
MPAPFNEDYAAYRVEAFDTDKDVDISLVVLSEGIPDAIEQAMEYWNHGHEYERPILVESVILCGWVVIPKRIADAI